jgi:hypothetical protein
MDDLKAGFGSLPADLAAAVVPLARTAAARAAGRIRAGYVKKTGELAGGVQVLEQPTGPYGVTVSVVNLTWWARVYEKGSKPRYTGRRGRARAYRGIMPARPVFGPIMGAERAAFDRQVVAVLRQAGLQVDAA